MTKQDIKRKHCPSCTEDFYNGHNSYSIDECWHLKTAKLVWGKIVGIWQNPPYDKVPKEKKPSCWRKQGVVFLKEEA